MHPFIYLPTDLRLQKIVSCIGYVDSASSSDKWLGLIPNGTTNITLSLGGEPITYHNGSGHSVIYSNYMSPVLLKSHKSLAFINIQLLPFGLRSLTNHSVEDLDSKAMTLDMLFTPSDCERLMNQILDCKEINKKFLAIEEFFVEKIDVNRIDERVLYAYKILKNNSSTSLDILSQQVCLSNRRIHELFKSHTSNSPSFYRKIQRFNRTIVQINSNPKNSLTDIAYTNGYFDQSHFIKDFKQFTGLTPSYFLKSRSKSSDFYNFLLDDPHRFRTE